MGTWGKRRYSSFELVSVALCTPLAGRRCVASKMPNVVWVGFVIGPKQLGPRSLTGLEQFRTLDYIVQKF